MEDEIIVEIRSIETEGAAKANVQVTLQTANGELTLCRFRIIHEEGKDPWLAYPRISYKPKDSNEYRNLKILLPSKRLEQAIRDAVIEKYSNMKTEKAPF